MRRVQASRLRQDNWFRQSSGLDSSNAFLPTPPAPRPRPTRAAKRLPCVAHRGSLQDGRSCPAQTVRFVCWCRPIRVSICDAREMQSTDARARPSTSLNCVISVLLSTVSITGRKNSRNALTAHETFHLQLRSDPFQNVARGWRLGCLRRASSPCQRRYAPEEFQ